MASRTKTRSLTIGTGDRSEVQQFRLRMLKGPEPGLVFESKGERTSIGAESTNDLVVTDPTVSRFHCELILSDGAPVIRDLGSHNGTLVEGITVREAVLRDHQKIALGKTVLQFELSPLQLKVPLSAANRFGGLVGHSIKTRAMFARLETAAAADTNVLIGGETGTGKEAAAEAIHSESARRDAPFIVVDCGAVPPALLESELFGHEKGAFSGASARRGGAFEAANGGTIFLDEIGELALEMQPKLLRAIESKEVKTVGGDQYRKLDFRVIAATHRNLSADVNAKRFRADLFFRLAVLQIWLPPLRERTEDLPDLVEHFLLSLIEPGQPIPETLRAAEFLSHLQRHSWPGNVRELRNYLERCLAMSDAPEFEGSADTLPMPDVAMSLRRAKQLFERRYLELALASAQGNLSRAARASGVDRPYLYRLLSRHGLR